MAKKLGYKKDEVVETPEQKAARESQEEKEFNAFSISQLGLKPELLALPKTLESKSDEELAYEEFKEERLKANPKLTEEKLRKQFVNENMLNDYPQFNSDAYEYDETEKAEALEKYEAQKREWEEDKADRLSILKNRANNSRQKMNQPIEWAKAQFQQFKNNEKIILKVTNEVDKFAKDFGNKFDYKTADGESIPIEFPNAEYKQEFIEKLKERAVSEQFQNQSGSIDLNKLSETILTADLRKNIDGVLKSHYFNKGVAEGRRNFKNPITQSYQAGAAVDLDKIKQANETNAAALKKLQSL